MLDAMTRCKNFLSETEHVFRSPDQCGQGDWFLAHSDTDRSLGGGLIGGMFIFSRNWEEDE